MMKMNIINTGRLLLLFMALILSWQPSMANVSGVNGVYYLNNNTSHCPSNGIYDFDYVSGSPNMGKTINSCTLSSNLYVPHTGGYSVEMKILNDIGQELESYKSSVAQFDGSKTISAQSVNVSSTSGDNFYWTGNACQYLVDNATQVRYALSSRSPCANGNALPPAPVPPDTSCTLNDGNALNVNLGNVDRAQLPTVPGSGSMRHIQVPVECTGGDVTVNMQLNYTPILLSAGQVIKSSSNGLGVSVVYNSKILSSTDTTPVTFTEGSNSIDLAFQAIRDPAVEIKDVPTGAFTASAVLVMTQQ